jgi:anti-sigma factor RsiW
MPACADRSLLLGALVDGELDAANTALLEAHVTRCEGCREELERLHAIKKLVASDDVRHQAPASLHKRIAALPELAAKAANSNRLPSWLAPGLGGALAASLAMITLVQPQAQSAIDQQIVSSHVRSLQPGHLTDVQTTNQHIVKPWFNGKIDFAPPVPELGVQGFPLAGGRLDSIDGRTVAAIVYRRRLHTVNLFIWPAKPAAARRALEDGFALAEWSDDGLRFAAVSDISPDELQQFETIYRKQSGFPKQRQ